MKIDCAPLLQIIVLGLGFRGAFATIETMFQYVSERYYRVEERDREVIHDLYKYG